MSAKSDNFLINLHTLLMSISFTSDNYKIFEQKHKNQKRKVHEEISHCHLEQSEYLLSISWTFMLITTDVLNN